jgi:hypothetical protein
MDALIGIRIIVYWGLYVVNEQPSQEIWNASEGDFIIIKHISRHDNICVSNY